MNHNKVDPTPTHVLFPILSITLASLVSAFNAELPQEEPAQEAILLVPEGQLDTQPFSLASFWEFYPNQLISAREMVNNPTRSLVQIPSWWPPAEGNSSIQYGTYRMKVIIPSSERQALALYMPDVYCSYQLQVNGKIIGNNGTVGSSKSESAPQWKPETYFFEPTGDTLEIIVQLSNFHHHRTGINNPLLLGRAELLRGVKSRTEMSDGLLMGGLTCLGILSMVLYFKKSKISFVLYALLCLSWIVRASFSNHYQIVQWFEDINWHLLVRTEYISLYLSTLFGSLLVGSLFPREVSKVFRILFLTACAGFTLFTLFVPPLLFTAYVQLYLGLSTLLLLSILVIVTRAYSESREGATLVLVAAFLAVVMFGYVIMAYQGIFVMNELFFNAGFLLQFIVTLVAIHQRVGKIDSGQDYDLMTFDGATRS